MELSPDRKSKLRSTLTPWVSSDSDIFGIEDIDRLIDDHPIVERRHMKLWLQSSMQLQQSVNSALWERSKQLFAEIQSNLPKYVASSAFNRASKLLEENRALVISGPPGVGKTTLARLLLGQAALGDYSIIQVSADIEEAFAVLDSRIKQAFYYDDFLGKTFLNDRLTKNEDSRLSQFINATHKSSNTVFVLTTREHILHQAQDEYEELDPQRLDLQKLTLKVDEYSRTDKARILANHLQFESRVSAADYRELASRSNYLQIIDHPNYNPRLIEMLSRGTLEVEGGSFLKKALLVLNNPSILWKHAFDKQLDDESQQLLLLVSSLPSPVSLSTVKETAAISPLGKTDVMKGVRLLQDAFIAIDVTKSDSELSLINPSLEDFLKDWLTSPADRLQTLLAQAVHFEQLVSIHDRFIDRQLLSSDDQQLVFRALMHRGGELLRKSPPKALRKNGLISLRFGRVPDRILWLMGACELNQLPDDLVWARDEMMHEDLTGTLSDFSGRRQFAVLVRAMTKADVAIPFRTVYATINSLIEENDEAAYEGLTTIRQTLDDYLSEEKLAEIRDSCEGLIEYRLNSPSWFDASWEVDTLRELVADWDLYIDDWRFDEIENALREAQGDDHAKDEPEEYLVENDDETNAIEIIFASWSGPQDEDAER